eukprot:s1430_g9.t1
MPKRGISGDEAGQDDVQTLCEERTWFVAENHRRQIRTFLRGPGNSEKYGIIDLFGASAQMSKMWRKAGWDAFAFDIKSNPDHDMTSAKGFWTLCAAAKKLKKKGLIFGGPPCSLYVWISKSIHKRSQENKFVGDTSRLKVRMSNRIVANMVVFLEELSAVKEFFSITEQPSSSEMFKMKNTSAMVRKLKMESVWTWMGLFGHELPKATARGWQGDGSQEPPIHGGLYRTVLQGSIPSLVEGQHVRQVPVSSEAWRAGPTVVWALPGEQQGKQRCFRKRLLPQRDYKCELEFDGLVVWLGWGRKLGQITEMSSPPTALVWAASSREVIAGFGNGAVVVFDLDQGEPSYAIQAHADAVTAAKWLDAPRRLLTASKDSRQFAMVILAD